MGQASVRSLRHAVNSTSPASGQLRLQCLEKISDRLHEWWNSGQSSPHDLHLWSGMLVGSLLMPYVSSSGVTRRALVDCYSGAGAIWNTYHYDGKPWRGANESMERLLL